MDRIDSAVVIAGPTPTYPDPKVSDPVAAEDAAAPTILDVVKKHLDDQGWVYETRVGDERTLINAGVQGENGCYFAAFDVREEPRHMLYIYISPHINFPEKNRKELAIYIARANYGLVLGNFELDMNDGEVRYKCSATAEGGALTDGMFSAMFHCASVTMDRYFGDMVKVGYGAMDPKDAIQEAERDETKPIGLTQ